MRHLSASAAIRESAIVAPSAKQTQPESTTTPMGKVQSVATPKSFRQHRQHHCPEAFPLPDKEVFSDPISVEPSDTSAASPVLISIGPNSNAVLDRFGLGDDLLPRLHTLVRTTCSSHWEAVLRSSPWNLTPKQALNLSRALSADLKRLPDFSITKVFLVPLSQDPRLVLISFVESEALDLCPALQTTWHCDLVVCTLHSCRSNSHLFFIACPLS